MGFKLIFEKTDKEDFLELPNVHSTKEGKSWEEIWEDYMKAYSFTRKKIDYFIENLMKLKNQLEDDFKEISSYNDDRAI